MWTVLNSPTSGVELVHRAEGIDARLLVVGGRHLDPRAIFEVDAPDVADGPVDDHDVAGAGSPLFAGQEADGQLLLDEQLPPLGDAEDVVDEALHMLDHLGGDREGGAVDFNVNAEERPGVALLLEAPRRQLVRCGPPRPRRRLAPCRAGPS